MEDNSSEHRTRQLLAQAKADVLRVFARLEAQLGLVTSTGTDDEWALPGQVLAEPLNDRQLWVLDMLERGQTVTRRAVEAQFQCSDRTAKRILGALVARGTIGFVGTPSPGRYVLRHPTGMTSADLAAGHQIASSGD
jgi:predicted HTH transcriptional regulator